MQDKCAQDKVRALCIVLVVFVVLVLLLGTLGGTGWGGSDRGQRRLNGDCRTFRCICCHLQLPGLALPTFCFFTRNLQLSLSGGISVRNSPSLTLASCIVPQGQ